MGKNLEDKVLTILKWGVEWKWLLLYKILLYEETKFLDKEVKKFEQKW